LLLILQSPPRFCVPPHVERLLSVEDKGLPARCAHINRVELSVFLFGDEKRNLQFGVRDSLLDREIVILSRGLRVHGLALYDVGF
jgi:hypothetical protein